MRLLKTSLIALTAIGTPAIAAPPPGIWANPRNSVHVVFKPCGDATCGTIVWANDKAKADAARGGTDRLVGTTLFDDLVEDEPGHWTGQVFVPDLGTTVAGTITRQDARTLIGEGCLFGRLGCKAQTWTRIDPAPTRRRR